MAYTHDFEISANGITVDGEINFGNAEPPSFKSTAGEEMTVQQRRKIQELFEFLVQFSKYFGEIDLMEISKKA